MGRFVVLRLLTVVPLLILVAVVVFVLFSFVPVDAAAVVLGQSATTELRDRLAGELGLDDPLHVQFTRWFGGLLRGDFGVSYVTRRPVLPDILAGLPITLSLVAGGLVVAFAVGIPVGMVAARRPNSLTDRGVTGAASVFQAMPEFWLALLLVLVVAVQLGLVPVGGYVAMGDDPVQWLRRLVLPWLALGLGPASQIARQTRIGMIEQMQSDYVRALIARGTPWRRVVGRYALKNALIPVLTLGGLQVAIMLGSSFVIERIFALPGSGGKMIDALMRGDTPMLQASILVVAFFVILANLVIDLAYGLLDPKVRPQ